MNATWKPFSIATSAAISATIVLPEPTSPCSSRFIGDRPLHVLDDLGDHLLLVAGQLERQHPPRRFADRVGDHDGARLPVRLGAPLAQHQPELKEKELFEDHPPLRGRAEPFRASIDAPSGGKCTS